MPGRVKKRAALAGCDAFDASRVTWPVVLIMTIVAGRCELIVAFFLMRIYNIVGK